MRVIIGTLVVVFYAMLCIFGVFYTVRSLFVSEEVTVEENKDMNQVQRILASDAGEITVAGTKYKGQTPTYQNMAPPNKPAHWVKVEAGIPYIRIN